MNEDNATLLMNVANEMEAGMIKGALAENGIEAFFITRGVGSCYGGGLSSVDVYVRASVYQTAYSIAEEVLSMDQNADRIYLAISPGISIRRLKRR